MIINVCVCVANLLMKCYCCTYLFVMISLNYTNYFSAIKLSHEISRMATVREICVKEVILFFSTRYR